MQKYQGLDLVNVKVLAENDGEFFSESSSTCTLMPSENVTVPPLIALCDRLFGFLYGLETSQSCLMRGLTIRVI